MADARDLSKLKDEIESFVSSQTRANLLSGLLIVASAAVVLGLIVFATEYYGEFGSSGRKWMFYSLVTLITGLIAVYVVKPLITSFTASHKKEQLQAAKVLGAHFSPLDDKALNALDLEEQLNSAMEKNALLLAGIQQKAQFASQFAFRSAVNWTKAARLAKYFAISIALLLAVWFAKPEVITQGGKRIVAYNEAFTPAQPFEFVVDESQLTVPQNSDVEIEVRLVGEKIPSLTFIELGGEKYRMKSSEGNVFQYKLRHVTTSIDLSFVAGEYRSRPFSLSVLATPKISQIESQLQFPPHTSFKAEIRKNQSNLVVPEGTVIGWKVFTEAVDDMRISTTSKAIQKDDGGFFFYQNQYLTDQVDQLVFQNNDNGLTDTADVRISVIPDQHPSIQTRSFTDSTVVGTIFFNGKIGDDYGLKNLDFWAVETETGKRFRKAIPIDRSLSSQAFRFIWKHDTLDFPAGSNVEYYFEVWDNDGINGSKSTRSYTNVLRVPSAAEKRAQREKSREQLESSLTNTKSKMESLDDELQSARKDLLDKKEPDWNDKQKMEELLKKQEEMFKNMENKAQQLKQQNQMQSTQSPYSERLMEKQRMLEEMFDNLFDEEFKEKYDEWNKLLENFDKKKALEQLDQMELTNDQLEKELDRTLELFKELEFEKKLEETVESLNDLKKDQDELQKMTEEKSAPEDELAKAQEKLNERFEELKDDLKSLQELNDNLSDPKQMPNNEDLQKGAEEQMNSAKENLENKKSKKAQENQKNASEKMDSMAKSMEAFQSQMEQEAQSENIEDLKQLLENILDLSLRQEALMDKTKITAGNDPKYVSLAQDQKLLIDDSQVVEDSLLALSKRVIQLEKIVNDEISLVKQNMDKALNYMTDQLPNQEQRFKSMATERQQLVMTSLNNLALLLDESLQQMQKAMAEMSGNKSCNKPGQGKGSKSSASSLKKMQEALNKQIEQMKKAMEEGKNPNGKKPGEQGSGGLGGMPKKLAQMAAQQAAIREQLRELSNSGGETGDKAGSRTKEMERMMEQTEEDILYNRISRQTLERQQDILTKLLESEKADRERELDQQREAEHAMTTEEIPGFVLDKYLKEKEFETELYRSTPAEMKPFFRNKVNSYFSNFTTVEP